MAYREIKLDVLKADLLINFAHIAHFSYHAHFLTLFVFFCSCCVSCLFENAAYFAHPAHFGHLSHHISHNLLTLLVLLILVHTLLNLLVFMPLRFSTLLLVIPLLLPALPFLLTPFHYARLHPLSSTWHQTLFILLLIPFTIEKCRSLILHPIYRRNIILHCSLHCHISTNIFHVSF